MHTQIEHSCCTVWVVGNGAVPAPGGALEGRSTDTHEALELCAHTGFCVSLACHRTGPGWRELLQFF